MKKQNAIKAALLVVLMAIVYWLYGGCRTMTETVGFHAGATLKSSFVTLLLLSPLLLGFQLWAFRKQKIRWLRFSAIVLAAWLFATAVSEIQILRDEQRFTKESQQASAAGQDNYSRERAWPNRSAALVWNRGLGIHATD